MRAHELTTILQSAVSPVILISGVGLLILSMTNRFVRLIDRSRKLGDLLRNAAPDEKIRFSAQLEILTKRARLLQLAITFATWSVLMAAILVIALFLTAFLNVEVVMLSAVLFISCLVSLIVALFAFLQDLNLSLAALKLELESK